MSDEADVELARLLAVLFQVAGNSDQLGHFLAMSIFWEGR